MKDALILACWEQGIVVLSLSSPFYYFFSTAVPQRSLTVLQTSFEIIVRIELIFVGIK